MDPRLCMFQGFPQQGPVMNQPYILVGQPQQAGPIINPQYVSIGLPQQNLIANQQYVQLAPPQQGFYVNQQYIPFDPAQQGFYANQSYVQLNPFQQGLNPIQQYISVAQPQQGFFPHQQLFQLAPVQQGLIPVPQYVPVAPFQQGPISIQHYVPMAQIQQAIVSNQQLFQLAPVQQGPVPIQRYITVAPLQQGPIYNLPQGPPSNLYFAPEAQVQTDQQDKQVQSENALKPNMNDINDKINDCKILPQSDILNNSRQADPKVPLASNLKSQKPNDFPSHFVSSKLPQNSKSDNHSTDPLLSDLSDQPISTLHPESTQLDKSPPKDVTQAAPVPKSPDLKSIQPDKLLNDENKFDDSENSNYSNSRSESPKFISSSGSSSQISYLDGLETNEKKPDSKYQIDNDKNELFRPIIQGTKCQSGVQCMGNSLVSIVGAHLLEPRPYWNAEYMDKIMNQGCELYENSFRFIDSPERTKALLKQEKNVKFLTVTELLKETTLFGERVIIEHQSYNDCHVASLFDGHHLFKSLKTELEAFFSYDANFNRYGMLVAEDFGRAIFRINGIYYLYDSHGYGHEYFGGKATLFYTEDFDQFTEFVFTLILNTSRNDINNVLIDISYVKVNFLDKPELNTNTKLAVLTPSVSLHCSQSQQSQQRPIRTIVGTIDISTYEICDDLTGCQCVGVCAVIIGAAGFQTPTEWNSYCIDGCINVGSNFYASSYRLVNCHERSNICQINDTNEKFLSVNELMKNALLFDENLIFDYSDWPIIGSLIEDNEYGFSSLEEVMNSFFHERESSDKYGILICSDISVAIFRDNGTFFLFDPNEPTSKMAVLSIIDKLSDLITSIKKRFEGHKSPIFDFSEVKISQQNENESETTENFSALSESEDSFSASSTNSIFKTYYQNVSDKQSKVNMTSKRIKLDKLPPAKKERMASFIQPENVEYEINHATAKALKNIKNLVMTKPPLSIHGKELYPYDGFTFRRDRKGDNADYYRCTQYDAVGCGMRITVYHNNRNNPVVTGTKMHEGHEKDVFEIPKRYDMQTLKNGSSECDVDTSEIKAAFYLLTGNDHLEMSEAALSRYINRYKSGNFPPHCPANLSELVIEDQFMTTIKGKRFLMFDSNWEGRDPNHRVLIFSTIENLNNLALSLNWGSDGTFDICPDIFRQFYTVHCDRGIMSIPMAYLLLATKDLQDYIYTIGKLIKLVKTYADANYDGPKTWTTDFEIAMIRAIELSLPDCEPYGCLFHFAQAIFRHIQDCGLAKLYRRSKIFNVKFRVLVALAFLPLDEIHDAFQDLMDDDFFYEYPEEYNDAEKAALKIFLKYFNDTWVGVSVNSKGERYRFKAFFDISLWNVRDRVLENKKLTTNDLEAYHTRTNQFFRRKKRKDLNWFFHRLRVHHEMNNIMMCKKSVTKKIRRLIYIRRGVRLREKVIQYRNSKYVRKFRNSIQGYDDPDGANQKDFLRIIAKMIRFYKDPKKTKTHDQVGEQNLPQSSKENSKKPENKPKPKPKNKPQRKSARKRHLPHELSSVENPTEQSIPKKRGRPLGSLNKPEKSSKVSGGVKKRGRPLGSSSRNKATTVDTKLKEACHSEMPLEKPVCETINGIKRKRGRPLGLSKKHINAATENTIERENIPETSNENYEVPCPHDDGDQQQSTLAHTRKRRHCPKKRCCCCSPEKTT